MSLNQPFIYSIIDRRLMSDYRSVTEVVTRTDTLVTVTEFIQGLNGIGLEPI